MGSQNDWAEWEPLHRCGLASGMESGQPAAIYTLCALCP